MTATGWRSPARSWRLVFIVWGFLSPFYLMGVILFVLFTPKLTSQVWVVWALLAILPVNLALVIFIYLVPYRRRIRAARTTLLKFYPIISLEQVSERIENAVRGMKLDFQKFEKATAGHPPTYYDFLFSDKDRGLDIGVHRPDRGGSYVSVRWKREQDESLAKQICESIDREMQYDASYIMPPK